MSVEVTIGKESGSGNAKALGKMIGVHSVKVDLDDDIKVAVARCNDMAAPHVIGVKNDA